MKLEVITYQDLIDPASHAAHAKLEQALLVNGIVGVSNVPQFQAKSDAYVEAARQFSRLPEETKRKYVPNRDAGEYEGYELGAEWFKNQKGEWQIDDKKASYYAVVPDSTINLWPEEVDLRTPYLALGQVIDETAKKILAIIGLNQAAGIKDEFLTAHGRMLHYQSIRTDSQDESDWCGAHYDHCVLTGLMPAAYFQNGLPVSEPAVAGLYIVPHQCEQLEKVTVADRSIMLFQAGEFGQILSNDRIHATKHLVKKSPNGIERFSFALFINLVDVFETQTTSVLVNDPRYQQAMLANGGVSYGGWSTASYDRYRVR